MRVQIYRYLARTIAEANDQHTPAAKGLAITIVAAVDDFAAKTFAAWPRWHVRDRVSARGNDDTTCPKLPGASVREPRVSAPLERGHPAAEERCNSEMSGVAIKVLNHLL